MGDYFLRELNNKHYIFKTRSGPGIACPPSPSRDRDGIGRCDLPWTGTADCLYLWSGFMLGYLYVRSGPGIYRIFFCLSCLSRWRRGWKAKKCHPSSREEIKGREKYKKDPWYPVNPVHKQKRLFMAPLRGLPHTTSYETVSQPSLSLGATEGSVAISLFPMHYEIASVVSLPRNDITTQPHNLWYEEGPWKGSWITCFVFGQDSQDIKGLFFVALTSRY